MSKDIKKIIEISNKLGWSVDIYNTDLEFRKYSPAGQDFSIIIGKCEFSEVIDIIQSRCDDFDCSEQAYLWLDNTGHGINGAPYDMKDVYKDMEDCLDMMKELYNELKKYKNN